MVLPSISGDDDSATLELSIGVEGFEAGDRGRFSPLIGAPMKLYGRGSNVWRGVSLPSEIRLPRRGGLFGQSRNLALPTPIEMLFSGLQQTSFQVRNHTLCGHRKAPIS